MTLQFDDRWLPIYDAPKDGTRIKVYIPPKKYKGHMRPASYMIARWVVPASDKHISDRKYDLCMKHDGYWSAHFKGEKAILGCPSHFQYLLPPRSAEGDE